ncbi:hypothetical protein [Rubripirellula lacrimiformis]|uniref:hypothetical protein n=1 Tax=Rubripirellula lacrimiformis TaxID=1930273 RepID=UPI001C54C960|nr:hypothetical protein [Rubripirellula lacrimiformis]
MARADGGCVLIMDVPQNHDAIAAAETGLPLFPKYRTDVKRFSDASSTARMDFAEPV